MIPLWSLILILLTSWVIQIVLSLLLIGLVHDMVVKAYRQLWREVTAAVWLRDKNLEDTPPAQEVGSGNQPEGPTSTH